MTLPAGSTIRIISRVGVFTTVDVGVVATALPSGLKSITSPDFAWGIAMASLPVASGFLGLERGLVSAVDGSQPAPFVKADVLRDEMDRAVAERHLHAGRMATARGDRLAVAVDGDARQVELGPVRRRRAARNPQRVGDGAVGADEREDP